MAITPNGRPVWERTADFSVYGGHVDKKNYLSQGVVDALTDVGAEGFSRMVSDAAAVARVTEFCVLTILCDDTTPGPPTVEFAQLMTGVQAVSYVGNAAPSGFPSVARNGDGDITLTFSSSYADEYSVSGAFEIQSPAAFVQGAAGLATTEKLTATTVRVRAFEPDGTAFAGARVRVELSSGA